MSIRTTQLPARNRLAAGFELFAADRGALIGACFLLFIVACGCLAPFIAPFGPNDADPALRLAPPGTPGHLLGLDHQGRDVLSRLLWGTPLTLFTGVVPVVVGAIVALPLGLVAAWYPRIGTVIMRVMDVLFAFPMALLAIMIAAFLGPGVGNMTLSLVVVLLPYNVRVVYQAALEQTNLPYVEALKACGTPVPTILFVELLPNVASAAIVYATTIVGSMVITAAGLSFLGLGVQPPAAEWGLMVAEGRSVIYTAPHAAAIPGLLLTLVVIAFSLVGDGVRDALEPRLRAASGR